MTTSTTPPARTRPGATGNRALRSAPTVFVGSQALSAPAAVSSSAATRNGPAHAPIAPNLPGRPRLDPHRRQHGVHEVDERRTPVSVAQHDVETERAAGLVEERLVTDLTRDALAEHRPRERVRAELPRHPLPAEQRLRRRLRLVLEQHHEDVPAAHELDRAAAEVAALLGQPEVREVDDGL